MVRRLRPRRGLGETLLSEESYLLQYFKGIRGRISAAQIRCHGDFHLGQVIGDVPKHVLNARRGRKIDLDRP